MDFPIGTNSANTLEHLGVTWKVAGDIFKRFEGRHDPRQCPDSVLDYVFGDLYQIYNASFKDLEA
jgi:hypothetical protein